jgi:DMSO/TMAO reductase YedYZ molybdopterin-dependent catalytic subunit
MRKMKTGKGVLFLAVFLILLAAVIFGIYVARNQAKGLGPVEIREYEGVDLSSINAFRENSIKGPQEIDLENYMLRITGLVADSKNYTYDEIINNHQHYKKVVTLDCVEGWSATILWEGLLVRDLLAGAGPLANAEVVIFQA